MTYSWQLPLIGTPGATSSFVASQSGSLLGMGLAFPLRMDATTNDFQRASDELNISLCLTQLVLTMVGERMDPHIGTIVSELLFDQSDVLPDLAEPSITDAIAQTEPRVKVVRVDVEPAELGAGVSGFRIRLRYIVRMTNARVNLVVPYIIPDAV